MDQRPLSARRLRRASLLASGALLIVAGGVMIGLPSLGALGAALAIALYFSLRSR